MAKKIDLSQPEIRKSLLPGIVNIIRLFGYDVPKLREAALDVLRNSRITSINLEVAKDVLKITATNALGILRLSRLEIEKVLIDEEIKNISGGHDEAGFILSAWKNHLSNEDMMILLSWLEKEGIKGWKLCTLFEVYQSGLEGNYTPDLFGDELLVGVKALMNELSKAP